MNRVARHCFAARPNEGATWLAAACLVACIDCGGRTPLDDWSAPPVGQEAGSVDSGSDPLDAAVGDADADAPLDAAPADAPTDQVEDAGATCVPPRVTLHAPTVLATTAYNVGPFWGPSALGLFWNEGVPNAGCYGALLWLKNGASKPTALPFDCASLVAVGRSSVYLTLNQNPRVQAFAQEHHALDNVGSVGAPRSLVLVGDQLVLAERAGGGVTISSEPVPLGAARTLTDFPGDAGVSLMTDGARLFATTASEPHAHAKLYEIELNSGARRAIATISDRPCVAGGGYVYQNRKDGGIERIDVATGEKSVAVPDRFGANAGVADAHYFYFTDAEGDVYRGSHCGARPQLIASRVDALVLQQDERYLYWWTGRAIVRLEKPP
jgi:hypothetical protein